MFPTRLRRAAAVAPLLLSLGFLSACQDPPPTVQPEVSRPVATEEVRPATLHSGLRFPGRVRAVQRASLAFNVPGRIATFPAREGQTLRAGELIAQLDTETFEVRLAAATAKFDEARTDYERVRQIWEKTQAIARAEVDQKLATLAVARSNYAAAKQDADDTRLLAPFDGVVVRRFVEDFQNVQAKEPVVSLQSVDDLEIVIHVPERVMSAEPRRTTALARFEGLPGRRFAASLKSYSSEADPQTQTYEVVLALTRPQDATILPGMSAEVLLDEAAAGAAPDSVMMPLQAVASGPDGAPFAWVVDPESSRVTRRPIQVGSIVGPDIVVIDGLQAGERIATAGLGHLREDMLVRPL